MIKKEVIAMYTAGRRMDRDRVWQEICFSLACFVLIGLVGCKKEKGTVITGMLTSLTSPYVVVTRFTADTLSIDTVPVNRKGKFHYNCPIDTFTVLQFYFDHYKRATVVFADKNQKIRMKGDAQFPDLIRVTGSEINNDLTSFKENNRDLLQRREQLLDIVRHRDEQDTLISTALSINEDVSRLNLINHELVQKAEEFIKEHPTNYSSLILISDFFINSENPRALERVLGYISGDNKSTRLAVKLQKMSEKINRSQEGAPMPYFKLTDKDKKEVTSNDFRGKYLLLSFVSTVGSESRENIALLKHEYSELRKDSVSFVTIYIDSDTYPIEYVEKDSIPWMVIPEKRSWASEIVDTYNIQYVPFNILVAPNGYIKTRNIEPQGVADTIRISSHK